MNYTKGEWTIDPNWQSGDYQDRTGYAIYIQRKHEQHLICDLIHTVDIENQEANARLITAAVNACASVNPDNPMAVAESIKDMYEALKVALNETPGFMLGEDVKQLMKQALAKAEGRELLK